MPPQIGYLLPTRERVMEGRPETAPLLELAARAEGLGFASVWVGDSLLARPRHDPLTLLAAVAARTRKVALGTAVFLPALRNPVVLAHQLATLDQISEGRLVLGAGIASDVPNIRAEFTAAGVPFEGRVGRMMEGLRLCPRLVDRQAGRLARPLAGARRRAGADPIPRRRPADLDGGFGPPRPRAGGSAFRRLVRQRGRPRPLEAAMGRGAADPSRSGARRQRVRGRDLRDPGDRRGRQPRRAADRRLSPGYYGQPAEALRRRQAVFGGPAASAAEFLRGFTSSGASHVIVRLVGDPDRQLETVAGFRAQLGK